MNFKQLLEKNKNNQAIKDLDTDLLSLFSQYYNDDDIEELETYEVYDKLNYNGSIDQHVDGLIDIYYYDLRKWSVDNFNYIDDAIEQGLTNSDTDFHSQIQAGQYVYYSEETNKELEYITECINELIENQGDI